ncbi:MAG: HlyD family efflux transporter periplasmic adaptor subunit [Candidatus Pacebacteria bacterium]|nr:HlyD family efflux transporter periplasmic adaptor subunit [Candidatus Paceibacterota bacterium]
MNRFIFRIRYIFSAFWHTFLRHPRKSIIVAVVLLVGTLALVLGGDTVQAPSEARTTTSVAVASVATLGQGAESLTLLGEVRAKSEADLRAQKSGQVTRVYVQAGQYVAPGTILAEIENQAERAGVLQAQGALAGAEASLAKVRGGARSEDKASATAQAEGATISLQASEEAARATYSSAFSATQDAIVAKSDTLFSNAYTVRPSFRVRSATYDESRAIEDERVALGDLLTTWKTRSATTLSTAELESALREAQSTLERVKTFLDSVSMFVSKQDITSDFTASQKAVQEGVMAGARAEIDGARQSVSGALQGIANARSAQRISSLTESKLVVGAQSEDLDLALAMLTQARAGLAGARALLERSFVRAPISGTVSTLAIQQGDYVNPGEVLAVVANKNALEVEVQVSDDVRGLVAVGATTTVDNTLTGIVTSIEPGLDPVTKKSRVHIGLPTNTTLTNGQYVSISLDNTTIAKKSAKVREGTAIPIEAIKVLPSGLALFTVNASSTLEAYSITEGTIVGDRMLVKSDVPLDLFIVTDVRGLSVGEQVTIDTNN